MASYAASLNGRRALVTASTHGTGAAIAWRLREEGAEVWTTARSAPEDDPDRQRFITADLTTVPGVSTVVERVSRAGGVDITCVRPDTDKSSDRCR